MAFQTICDRELDLFAKSLIEKFQEKIFLRSHVEKLIELSRIERAAL
jgi:hypothetical protein